MGDQTTWAAYLGLFKHEQAWPCLQEALDKLIPGRYRLHPRFRLDERTGKWEFLEPHLYHWKLPYVHQNPEEMLRWERRFLD